MKIKPRNPKYRYKWQWVDMVDNTSLTQQLADFKIVQEALLRSIMIPAELFEDKVRK